MDAAMRLHHRGYNVIASARNTSDLKPLQDAGVNHLIELDLRSSGSIGSAVDYALDASAGRLSAVFNNGAYGQPGAVEDLSREALKDQFETNLFGTHELTRCVLPTLLDQPDARIINCSSVLGFVAMSYRGAYNASKFALEGLTDTLRLELKNTSVKVVLIQPGPIATRFRKNALQALEQNIDIDSSRHAARYQEAIKRLKKEGPAMPFTLEPEAVTKALFRALEAKNPRPKYRVTTPTQFMALSRRFLSTRMLDRLLVRAG